MADLVVTNRRAVAGNVSHAAAWFRLVPFAAVAAWAAVQGGLAVARGITAFDVILLVVGLFSALVAAQIGASIARSRGQETVQLLPNEHLVVEGDRVLLPRAGVQKSVELPLAQTRTRVDGRDLVIESEGQRPVRIPGATMDPSPADVAAWFAAHGGKGPRA